MKVLAAICGWLCASKLGINKLGGKDLTPSLRTIEKIVEVHIRSVTTTATVTATVTETVGIVATPVVHTSTPKFSPAAVQDYASFDDFSFDDVSSSDDFSTDDVSSDGVFADAASPSSPSFFSGLGFSSADELTSTLFFIGQVLSEPFLVIPVSIIGILAWLFCSCFFLSFCFFYQHSEYRETIQEILEDLYKAFCHGSLAVWVLFFGFLHCFADEDACYHPLHILLVEPLGPETFGWIYAALTDEFDSGVSMERLRRKLWEAYRPVLLESVEWYLLHLQEAVTSIDVICQLALTIVLKAEWLIEKILGLLITAMEFLSRPIRFAFELIGQKGFFILVIFWPSSGFDWFNIWVHKWIIRDQTYYHRVNDASIRNMSLDDRVNLIEENRRLHRLIAEFISQNGFVGQLAARAIDYRTTILALIREANYLRHVMDIWATNEYDRRYGIDRNVEMVGLAFNSAKLKFCEEKGPDGLFFKIEKEERHEQWINYEERARRATLSGLGMKQLKVRRDPLRPKNSLYYEEPLFTTHQVSAWGLEARMERVRFPDYDTFGAGSSAGLGMTLAQRNEVQVDPSSDKLEDLAYMGKGMETWEKMEREAERKWKSSFPGNLRGSGGESIVPEEESLRLSQRLEYDRIQ